MPDGLFTNILRCHDSEALATLNSCVAEHGLALVRAQSGGLLLCKVQNGRPVADSLFENYISIPFGPLAEDLKNTIVDFILTHKSEAMALDDSDRTGILGLYGSSIQDGIRKDRKREAENDLIEAIADLLGDGYGKI